ncbi:hypothetical protein [Vogesella sp. AC12]|uniref:hypothetical protein n=1 Tax=Vogesella sp. AC12 TaxID=2950550 RepID=UPI00210EF2DF|nr:hypothetical protein [Vogesella sp. AC12]MCQ4143607.1 hypothetical protein [Vogesella sp. AC12]
MLLRIYTEGDLQRGLGHLTRCSAYAAAWRQREGGVCWVVDGDEAARNALLGESVDWRKAWQEEIVMQRHDAVAIVDSYTATLSVLQSISDNHRQVVYLDDTFRLSYPAGLVVHSAPGKARQVNDGAQWLWGPAWQPLRPAFWNIPLRKDFAPEISRVLILMGGTDVRNLIPAMVFAVRSVYPVSEINVVVARKDYNPVAGEYVHYELSAEQMAKLMLQSDIAISAAGQTTYELAACGLPAVLVLVADNQRTQLDGWQETGTFKYAGEWNDVRLMEKVMCCVRELRTVESRMQLSMVMQQQVDGGGAVLLMEYLANNGDAWHI